jgi:hypothetical protein
VPAGATLFKASRFAAGPVDPHHDPFAADRLPPEPVPADAKFKVTVSMLACYKGEDLGTRYGTCVEYLNHEKRQAYKLSLRDGKVYDAKGTLYDTTRSIGLYSLSGVAMFVMDHSGDIYASTRQVPGKFHHSSFLAGAAVAAAGEMEVRNGDVTYISRRSGHYFPTEAQLDQMAENLRSQGATGFEVDKKVN